MVNPSAVTTEAQFYNEVTPLMEDRRSPRFVVMPVLKLFTVYKSELYSLSATLTYALRYTIGELRTGKFQTPIFALSMARARIADYHKYGGKMFLCLGMYPLHVSTPLVLSSEETMTEALEAFWQEVFHPTGSITVKMLPTSYAGIDAHYELAYDDGMPRTAVVKAIDMPGTLLVSAIMPMVDVSDWTQAEIDIAYSEITSQIGPRIGADYTFGVRDPKSRTLTPYKLKAIESVCVERDKIMRALTPDV